MKQHETEQDNEFQLDISAVTDFPRNLIKTRIDTYKAQGSFKANNLDLRILEGTLVWIARQIEQPHLAKLKDLYQNLAGILRNAAYKSNKLEPYREELLSLLKICTLQPTLFSETETLTTKDTEALKKIIAEVAALDIGAIDMDEIDTIGHLAKKLNAPNLITRLDLIRRSENTDDKLEQESAVSAINSLYWDTAEKIISDKLQENKNETFSFSIEEKLLIDYGLINKPIQNSKNTINRLIGEYIDLAGPQSTPVKIISLTDFLDNINTEKLNLSRKQSLRDMVDATQTELSTIKERLAQLRKSRESLQSVAADNEKLAEIDNKIQHINWLLQELQHETIRGIINPDDRHKITQYKKQMVQLRTAKEYILNDLVRTGADKAILELDNQIFQLSSVFMKLGYDLYELIDMLEEDEKHRKDYIDNKRCKHMFESLKHINTITQMIARHSGLTYSPRLKPSPAIATIKEIEAVLEDLEKTDKNIFVSQIIEKKGRPKLVLLPGAGNGLYDWKSHAFFVPLCPVRNIEHSVLCAAAEWRIDADEDKKMKESFLKASNAPASTSTQAYRTSFTSSYIAWITLEAKGFQSLPQPIKKWFDTHIAKA